MPLLRSTSYPGASPYLINGHLQTIIPSMLRKVEGVIYERERLILADDDFVDLDWIDRRSKRLVIISHGLEGDSNRHYVLGTAKLFAQQGWDVLAWNCRSCSGEMNHAFRLYNHGEIGDIDEVLQYALRTKQYEEITLVGYSMGGNIILKYLGVHGRMAPDVIRSAVAVSSPTDLGASARQLDLRSNWLYRQRFMKKLVLKIQQKADQFPGRLDMTRLQQVQLWRDFDDFFSAPVNGYQDADDFYTQASAVRFMPSIAVPTLLINAQNDPILSPECSPVWLAADHPMVYLETPRTGGHVGFWKPGDTFSWSERRALEFAEAKGG